MNKKTAGNMGFMQCGGEGIIEHPFFLVTKNHFVFLFFVILKKIKWFLFRAVKV